MKKILNDAKAKNPYPEDIFTKPAKEEYITVQKLFKDAGLVQDKFFGAFGRKVWNNCINTIEQLIKEKEMEKVYEIIHDAKQHIDEDPHLANYILRDLKVIKDAGLVELSWAMHKNGCVKEDVEYLISQLEKYLQAPHHILDSLKNA